MSDAIPSISTDIEKLREQNSELREALRLTRRALKEEIDHITDSLDQPILGAAQASLQSIVNEQAEDPALWCLEPTITEHLLQQALRRLHAAIEGESVSPATRNSEAT